LEYLANLNAEIGLGNCGKTNNRKEKVLAIGKKLYDRNGGKNCGQVRYSLFAMLKSQSSIYHSSSKL